MSDAGHVWKMLPHVSRCCYARVRCQVNEAPTPEYPGEIVAVALGVAP